MSSSLTPALSRRLLLDVFADVPDPGDPRGIRHPMPAVLALA